MKCPKCNVDLLMTDRQGVEIDYCPTCRGVWLDRGELDKIIERSETAFSKKDDDDDRRREAEFRREPEYRQGDDDYRHQPNYGGHYNKHRKKSFLKDFFDFD
ncbi:MAG: zf-TFIIB domain-containing protein [Bacteroidota bacterium]